MPKIVLPDNPEYVENYSLVYAHNKNSWQFMGWRCMTCDKVIRQISKLKNHPNTHTVYKRLSEDEQLQNVQILTVDRKNWTSFAENNQTYPPHENG